MGTDLARDLTHTKQQDMIMDKNIATITRVYIWINCFFTSGLIMARKVTPAVNNN